jgi:hypothetical protein
VRRRRASRRKTASREDEGPTSSGPRVQPPIPLRCNPGEMSAGHGDDEPGWHSPAWPWDREKAGSVGGGEGTLSGPGECLRFRFLGGKGGDAKITELSSSWPAPQTSNPGVSPGRDLGKWSGTDGVGETPSGPSKCLRPRFLREKWVRRQDYGIVSRPASPAADRGPLAGSRPGRSRKRPGPRERDTLPQEQSEPDSCLQQPRPSPTTHVALDPPRRHGPA